MSLTINGRQINVQGIREINPGLTIQQASQKTKSNGLDEVYFNSNGKSYIAYGDALNISMLHKSAIPKATFNGQSADIITFEDEINTTLEGMQRGAVTALKDTGDAVIGAVKNIITTIGPTVAVGGGAAVAGYSIYQIMKAGTLSTAVGASSAAGLAAGGAGGISQGILDALKSGAVGALKIIAITGVVGAGVTMTYGAIRGAMNAQNINKDYSTITSVTQSGMAPTNGGQALESSPTENVPMNPGGNSGGPEGVPTNPVSTQPYFPITQSVPQYQGVPQYQQVEAGQPNWYQTTPQTQSTQHVQLSGLKSPQALFNR